jgi:protein-tyrosine kinase
MLDLIGAFANHGRNSIVIYDLPPVLTADDAVAISPLMDAFLFVVSEGETGRDEALDVIETLADVNMVGVLLNKSFCRGTI